MLRLVNDPIVNEYDLSVVKLLAYGAAPMSTEVLAMFNQKFPHVVLRNNWGMTELCGGAATPAQQYQRLEYAHTAGKVLGSMSVKVVDPVSGKELAHGQVGEIMIKGPTVTMGYLDNERATRETFEPDGWLHTGDLGAVDEEGFITIQVNLAPNSSYRPQSSNISVGSHKGTYQGKGHPSCSGRVGRPAPGKPSRRRRGCHWC